jgi:zinc transport system substrate-binding protein
MPITSPITGAARLGVCVSIAAALTLAIGSGPPRAEDLKVVATIKPIHALVTQVMGDTGTPKLLVQGAASPHTYSLRPSDARALNQARVVFRVSEQIEPFTRRIVASLPKSVTVSTLAEAPGLTLLDVRTGDTFEAHDDAHDHGHKYDKQSYKKHGHEEHDHDDHGNGGTARDAHVWLDPDNAIAMVKEIARVLAEAAPDKAAVFEANAAKAIAGIEVVKKEIAETVAPLRGKPFVVFHDAYQYFEAHFGIPAIGAITVSPEVQPSAKRLTEIRSKIKQLNAVCVFAEPQFKSKLVATVTEGTKARAGTLDPEGAMIEPGPSSYVELLKGLAASLKSCLAPSA